MKRWTVDRVPPIDVQSRPPKGSASGADAPELIPVENIWQFPRGNWLSSLVFETYDDIIDAACDAWHKLIARPETITLNRNARMGLHRLDP